MSIQEPTLVTRPVTRLNARLRMAWLALFGSTAPTILIGTPNLYQQGNTQYWVLRVQTQAKTYVDLAVGDSVDTVFIDQDHRALGEDMRLMITWEKKPTKKKPRRRSPTLN